MTKRRFTVPAWVIIALGAVVTVGVVLWVSSLTDDSGAELLDGPAASVIVGVLGFLGTTLALLVKRTGEVKYEVSNSHQENLRDDLDGKHDKIWARLDLILRRLVAGDERMGRIEQLLLKHETEIDAIGDTLSKRKD